MAPTQQQARFIFDYAAAFIDKSPLLKPQLQSATRTELRLLGGVTIAVHPNSFRSVRGRTMLACIFDETAQWSDESSANPDLEVYRACLPSLATTGGMLIGIGSPYRRVGLLHQKRRDHFGQDTPRVLVVHGDSLKFNPTLDTEIIAQAEADDPESALSEWRAEFRTDISALLDDGMIDRAIDAERPLEIPARLGVRYVGFYDPSGGRRDASVLCVGHLQPDGVFVADAVRGVPSPHDPRQAVRECAELARAYRLTSVWGDNYSGEWVSRCWDEFRIRYQPADKRRSDIYLEALPSFARGTIKIPNHQKLIRELRLLERRTHKSGKDTVDHPQYGGATDDHANAALGCLWASQKPPQTASTGFIVGLY